MKKKKNLWTDVSILIVAVLAITAFLRGKTQFVALVISFTLWAVYAVCYHLLPHISEIRTRKQAKKIKAYCEKQAEQQTLFWDLETTNPISLTLLRHVNHRISAFLQSSYPDATWDWCERDPESFVTKGGTGRIKLNGVPDFNYAEITLDQNAKIGCELLNIVPLGANSPKTEDNEPAPNAAPPSEVNPQIWYEQTGKAVLTNLIVDLNSRGYNSLTIQEDGNIVIKQDNKDIKQRAFESLPEKATWPRLAKVFDRNGLAAEITQDSIVLSW